MRPPRFSVGLFFWIVSFPPEQFRITNYQQRGLGTAMVEFMINYAREKSAKRIVGQVKPRDFKDYPELPDWYRRRGFAVVMGEGKATPVASISFVL